MSIKIGIMLPRSDVYPTLALDFLNGFRLALSARGDNVDEPKLLIESIGNATGDTVLKSAEKMILQENVDVTMSLCSIFNLKELVNIFNAYRKNLIHLDLGGNVLTPEHISPFVIHHTLNLWQSTYRAGEFAAREIGKNAVVAASFYDGGYHLMESFIQGFTANGGNVIFTYVAPFDYQTETYKTLVEGIENTKPDLVFSLFSHNEEKKVLKIFSDRLSNKSLPVIWSPLIDLREKISENYGLKNVLSLSSWDYDSEEKVMKSFNKRYQDLYKTSPNVVSLLGFETGLTVSRSIKDKGKLPSELGTFCSDLITKSPRGELSFNSFHESQTPVYSVLQYDFTELPYKRTVLKQMELNGEEKMYLLFNDQPASGWHNPYIIT